MVRDVPQRFAHPQQRRAVLLGWPLTDPAAQRPADGEDKPCFWPGLGRTSESYSHSLPWSACSLEGPSESGQFPRKRKPGAARPHQSETQLPNLCSLPRSSRKQPVISISKALHDEGWTWPLKRDDLRPAGPPENAEALRLHPAVPQVAPTPSPPSSENDNPCGPRAFGAVDRRKASGCELKEVRRPFGLQRMATAALASLHELARIPCVNRRKE